MVRVPTSPTTRNANFTRHATQSYNKLFGTLIVALHARFPTTIVIIMSVDEQIFLLRQELKIWEKNFTAENGGRKAGREDIKRDPAIGQSESIYLGFGHPLTDDVHQLRNTKNMTSSEDRDRQHSKARRNPQIIRSTLLVHQSDSLMFFNNQSPRLQQSVLRSCL